MLSMVPTASVRYRIGDRYVTIRAMSNTDDELQGKFFKNLSPLSKHYRSLDDESELTPNILQKLSDINGTPMVAFVATIRGKTAEQYIGFSRCVIDKREKQLAITVSVNAQWQHQGIGRLLMIPVIEYARDNGIKPLYSLYLKPKVIKKACIQGLHYDNNTDPSYG